MIKLYLCTKSNCLTNIIYFNLISKNKLNSCKVHNLGKMRCLFCIR